MNKIDLFVMWVGITLFLFLLIFLLSKKAVTGGKMEAFKKHMRNEIMGWDRMAPVLTAVLVVILLIVLLIHYLAK